MESLRILICCAAGYSSGLLAQKTKKAANARGITANIDARSESQAESFLGKIDVMLLAPHYANVLEQFKALAEPYGVPVVVIPHRIYGLIDGNAMLDLAIEAINQKNNNVEGEKQ